ICRGWRAFRRGWSGSASAPSMCAARPRNRELQTAEEPTMPIALPPQPTRRAALRLAGNAAAVAVLARPLVGLAQTPAAGQPMKIATIGAGREGSALGTLFVKAGHKVMFSSRHPEQLKDLVAGLGPLAQAGTVADAIAFGEVVLL